MQNCKISNFIFGPNINILAGTDEIKAMGKIVNKDFLKKLRLSVHGFVKPDGTYWL